MMKNKDPMKQKFNIMKMLYDNGYRTEKELKALSATENLITLPIKSHEEMKMIVEIVKCVNKNTLYSYLCMDEENEVKEE